MSDRRNLLVVSEDYTVYDGLRYYARNPLSLLFQELTEYYNTTLCTPVVEGSGKKYTEIHSRLTVRPRPYYENPLRLYFHPLKLAHTFRIILREVKKSDVVLLRIFSTVAPIVQLACAVQKQNYLVYLAGDFSRSMREGNKYVESAALRCLRSGAAIVWECYSRFLCRNRPILTAGSHLVSKYRALAMAVESIIPSVIPESTVEKAEDSSEQTGPLRLLYVGRIVKTKGLDSLVKAVAGINGRDGWRLSVVGDGPQMTNIKKLCANLGVESNVDFKGFVAFGQELFSCYRQCDVLVCPSLTEGAPKVVVEAMAFGLPVVATPVGGIGDVVEEGVTGLLVNKGSVSDLREAIRRLVNDRSLVSSMGRTSKMRSKKYTRERTAYKVYRFIEATRSV